MSLSICPICDCFINRGQEKVKMYPGGQWVHEKCLERKRGEESESVASKSPALPTPARVEPTSDTRPGRNTSKDLTDQADGVAGAGTAPDLRGNSSSEIRPSHSDHNPYRGTKYARNSDKL
jgi:hypothetical protein